jgi:hypothetical protein
MVGDTDLGDRMNQAKTNVAHDVVVHLATGGLF